MTARRALLAFVLLSGCSSRGTESSVADASAPMADDGAPVLAVLRELPDISQRFATRGALVRVGDGFRGGAVDPWSAPGSKLEVTIPASGDRPLRLAIAGESDVWITITTEGHAAKAANLEDHAVIVRGVRPATDVVHVATEARVEELRVLRDASAPASTTYRIQHGPGVSRVRLAGRRVEVVDRAGLVRIQSDAIFAVDAKGTRRELSVTLREDASESVLEATLDPSELKLPIVIDPAWSAAASAPATLSWPQTISLSDGRILVTQAAADAYRYAPATNTWTSAGTRVYGSGNYAQARLGSGKVLLAGGGSTNAELYDPATNTWAAAPAMAYSRNGACATTLSSGSVLVAGGYNSAGVPNLAVELFNGTAWTTVASTAKRYSQPRCVTLSSGKVLIAGESSGPSTELYDPTANAWAAVTPPSAPQGVYENDARLIVLLDGRVLWVSSPYKAHRFDPATSTWTDTGSVPWPYLYDRSTAMELVARNGHVLFTGGKESTTIAARTQAYDYDPSTNAWTAATSMLTPRAYHAIARIPAAQGGGVIVLGGSNDDGLAVSTAEIYTPQPSASACAGGADCQTGVCSQGYCCATSCAAPCAACDFPGSIGTCTGSCGTACAGDANCRSTAFCDAGVCTAKKANGGTCVGARECASGKCVDGYCCESACTATCYACDVPGRLGRCSPEFSGMPHGTRSNTCAPYACNWGGCLTQCSGTDSYCATGYYCKYDSFTTVWSCVAKQANGTACGAGNVCTSGTCYSGVCCASSNCEPYATCGTGTCPTTCSADASCSPGYYCGSGGTCIAKRDNGVACTAGRQCQTGSCVDGVCCSSSCAGQCEACDVEGSVGSCTTGFLGPAHGSRPSCSPYVCNWGSCVSDCSGSDSYCATGFFCGGSSCTAKYVNGVSCTGGNQCQSGQCVDGVCCNATCTASCSACNLPGTTGTCSPVGSGQPIGGRTCGDYACVSGSCATSCTADTACRSTHFCSSGACVPKKSVSDACAGNNQCDTGFCVDGFCCDRACSGQCEACDLSGKQGFCDTSFVGAPHGGRASCSPYVCNYGSCTSSCSTDAYCAAGYFCKGGACAAKYVNGAACFGGNQCQSGNCIDGVCCNTSCTASCSACNLPGSLGSCSAVTSGSPVGARTCGAYACVGGSCATSCTADDACRSGHYCSAGACVPKKNVGATCTGSNQCGTGFCVDGFCCDRACLGQCEACDVKAGQCSTEFAGPPHGTRASCAPYLCQYGSCGTKCASDGECASGNFCQTSTGLCFPTKVNGAACTGKNECKSGFCADGRCCNTACTGKTCEACDVGGSEGSCVDVASGAPHGARSCSPFSSCVSGACATTCGADSDCVAGRYCAGGACLAKKSNGAACTAENECGSGFCADSVCCNAACTDQCAACNIGGKVGTCSAVTGAPRGTRPACTGVGTGTACGPACNGSDTTRCLPAAGTTPCSANACSSGVETHASFCDGAGRCNDVPRSCGAYACSTASCKSSCIINGDCALGFYCKGGVCLPATGLGDACKDASTCSTGYCVDGVCCATGSCAAGHSCATPLAKGVCAKDLGTTCANAAECGSGYCVDGRCCDSSCTGQCAACDVLGKEGRCTAVIGAPHGGRPICEGTGIGTTCGITCTGLDASKCTYPSATACGSNSCKDGIETHVSFCNGGGSCNDVPRSCGAYACDVTSCKTSCSSKADCASGFWCSSGTCVPVDPLGRDCTSSASCASGNCVDGVCCESSTCGEGRSCAFPAAKGKCVKVNGTDCAAGDECGSKSCVDGVCCDRACDGQCEACDVASRRGTCWPVSGKPHGSRTACSDGAGEVCKALECDGSKDVSKCVAYAFGTTKECKVATCDVDRFTAASTCDGFGGCRTPETKTCAPYACDEKGCRTDCTADAQCAKGNRCLDSKCVPVSGATCSSDGLSSVASDGKVTACLAYRCRSDGTCGTNCSATTDCAPGNLCDPGSGACVAATSPPDEGGGCGCETAGRRRDGAWLLVVALALPLLRRRRRAGVSKTTDD
ncbi:MAG: hypothetical protein HYV09_14650 [Deltaproteobacteria bacterium]|nr:hypothetical protein [Deltaproteobacteria bacterium]